MNSMACEDYPFAREFVEVPGGFRRSVENAIEGLIDVLDQLDADPDLEDDGRQLPSLPARER